MSPKVEAKLPGHSCHLQTKEGGREVAGVGEVVAHRQFAEVAEAEAQQHSLLREGVGVEEGQQNRGEEGRQAAMVAAGCLGSESPQEVAAGGLLPAVAAEELEEERSLAWLLEGIQSEELVEGGLD